MDPRAQMLIERGRFAEAAECLRAGLAQQPDDPRAHAMLGLCMIELKRLDAAEHHLTTAIAFAPDAPLAHNLLAFLRIRQHKLAEARDAADEAIRLAPQDPSHYFMRAQADAAAERWKDCVARCDQGLELDPEHDGLLNLRTTALTHLGLRDEASQTVQQSLRNAPEDPWAHANLGWAMLHQNKTREALRHFEEALRLDPGFDWAKAGLVEALKARNPVYRVVLAWFLWLARLTPRTRMFILVGGYIAYQALRSIASANPAFAPYVWPLLGVYIGFALLSWTVQPFFNLTLITHPAGRYALTHRQFRAAVVFGIFLALGIAVAIAGLVTWVMLLFYAAAFLGIMAIVWGTALGDVPTHRTAHYITAASVVTATGVPLLAVLGLEQVGLTIDPALSGLTVIAFFGSFLAFQFFPATPWGR